MNQTCEVCDGTAKLKCNDCNKINFYCNECFERAHSKDGKKGAHKFESLASNLRDGTAPEENSFCTTHPAKLLEFICLACDTAVCSNCIAFGEHKGHDIGSFKEGFDKLTKSFKADSLLGIKNEDLKESEKRRFAVLLKNNIKKMEIMKQKTKENFHDLIQAIKEKKAEVMRGIKEEIGKMKEEIDSIEDVNMNIKSNLDVCHETLKKTGQVTYSDYNHFSNAYTEFKKLRPLLTKCVSANSFKERTYLPISLDPIQDLVAGIKVDETTFEARTESEIELKPKVKVRSEVRREPAPKPVVNNVVVPKPVSMPAPIPEAKKVPEVKQRTETTFENSLIVYDVEDQKLLRGWVSEAYGSSKVNFQLLWKGSVDGFGANVFHSRCDDKGATCTVIRSNQDNVFGGYTSKSWKSSGDFSHDPKAFLYSLTHKAKHANQKDNGNSVYYDSRFGPIFGSGFDLCVVDNCNVSEKSYSQGDSTYELPAGKDSQTYYAGAFKFKVKEIEVYSISTN